MADGGRRPSLAQNESSITDTVPTTISTKASSLFHYHLDTTSRNQSLTKRGYARPMTMCIRWVQGWNFVESRCDNAHWATVFCRRPGDAYMATRFTVECQPNEICIDTGAYSIYGPGGGKAYCVSTENFVDIATAQLTALAYDLPDSGPASKATSAEALMVPRGIDGPPKKAR